MIGGLEARLTPSSPSVHRRQLQRPPSLILVFGLVGLCFAAATGFRTGGGLIGMVVWGFDQASPTSLLGRRRLVRSSPAAWSLLRTGFCSFVCIFSLFCFSVWLLSHFCVGVFLPLWDSVLGLCSICFICGVPVIVVTLPWIWFSRFSGALSKKKKNETLD